MRVELLAGDLDYHDFKRLPREDEAVVEAVNTSRSKAVYTGEGVPRAGCKVKRI